MDGSDKNVSSSSTPKKPPSISKGTDENEESYQEMGLNVQNLKKPTTKHFMSPTISAASKANPPRKKILTERNESFDNSFQKIPNLDSRIIQRPTTSLDSKTTSSSDEFDDLSSRVYDPVTNYLSPRPKFLRYKPNRRQEILLRKENQVREGKENVSLEPEKGIDSEVDLVSSCGSLAAGSKEADLKQESEEIDESDDEFEEIEEEGGWSLKGGVVKVLILLVVLVISASYISSMNSPTPSPVVQAVVGLKDGYQMIHDHMCGFVNRGKYLLIHREGKQIDGLEKAEMIGDVKIGGEEEFSDGFNEVVEIESGESKVLETVEDEVEGVVNEFSEEGESELENEEKGIVGEFGKVVEIDAGEIADSSDLEMAKTREVSDLISANSELHGSEAVEVLARPLTILLSVEDAFEKENEPIKEGIFNREIVEIGNITDYKNDHEPIKKEGLIKHMETESILKVIIGFSLFSSIIASLVLGLHFRKNRNIVKKETCPVVEPNFDSVIAEKCSSLLANEEDKHIDNPVSFAKSKFLINSLEEDSKQTYESRAPSIELLGELVVGEMSSSSLRSCGMKSRMIESEVSSHSISMEKGIGSKANSVPVHLQTAFSDISNMNFHSYSDDKKFVKKEEGGGDGEGKKVEVTTPLRRSSRIRHRAIASP